MNSVLNLICLFVQFYSVDDTFQVKQISNAYDGLTSNFLSRQKLKKGKNSESLLLKHFIDYLSNQSRRK